MSTHWLGEDPTPAAFGTLYVASTRVKEMLPGHRVAFGDDEHLKSLFFLIRTALPDPNALIDFDELPFMDRQHDGSVTNCSERMNKLAK